MIPPPNPMDDVDRLTAHKKEVQIPPADEYERFLDQVQGTRYYAFCVLAAAWVAGVVNCSLYSGLISTQRPESYPSRNRYRRLRQVLKSRARNHGKRGTFESREPRCRCCSNTRSR